MCRNDLHAQGGGGYDCCIVALPGQLYWLSESGPANTAILPRRGFGYKSMNRILGVYDFVRVFLDSSNGHQVFFNV